MVRKPHRLGTLQFSPHVFRVTAPTVTPVPEACHFRRAGRLPEFSLVDAEPGQDTVFWARSAVNGVTPLRNRPRTRGSVTSRNVGELLPCVSQVPSWGPASSLCSCSSLCAAPHPSPDGVRTGLQGEESAGRERKRAGPAAFEPQKSFLSVSHGGFLLETGVRQLCWRRGGDGSVLTVHARGRVVTAVLKDAFLVPSFLQVKHATPLSVTRSVRLFPGPLPCFRLSRVLPSNLGFGVVTTVIMLVFLLKEPTSLETLLTPVASAKTT